MAAAQAKKRLVLLGFPAFFSDAEGLNEVVRLLGERGLVDGRQIEVVRFVVDPVREGATQQSLDYLVRKLERELLPLKPDVIVTLGAPLTKGAHLATRTIPIVTSVSDPVDIGVAQSLARPGGNVTGLAGAVAETSVKLMEMLRRLVPRASRVAVFHDPRPMATKFAGLFERAARSVGLEPVMVSSLDLAELIKALRGLPARKVQAAIMAWSPVEDPEPFYREALAARIPLMGVTEQDAARGALAAYFANDPSVVPRLVPVVEQVLRGANPAEIPFRYPQTFRLVINQRSAKSLGIKVPPELLLRADRVIE